MHKLTDLVIIQFRSGKKLRALAAFASGSQLEGAGQYGRHELGTDSDRIVVAPADDSLQQIEDVSGKRHAVDGGAHRAFQEKPLHADAEIARDRAAPGGAFQLDHVEQSGKGLRKRGNGGPWLRSTRRLENPDPTRPV